MWCNEVFFNVEGVLGVSIKLDAANVVNREVTQLHMIMEVDEPFSSEVLIFMVGEEREQDRDVKSHKNVNLTLHNLNFL